MENNNTEIKKKAWWEWLAPLWLGPYAILKGKEAVVENKEDIVWGATYVLVILVLILCIIIATKR